MFFFVFVFFCQKILLVVTIVKLIIKVIIIKIITIIVIIIIINYFYIVAIVGTIIGRSYSHQEKGVKNVRQSGQ